MRLVRRRVLRRFGLHVVLPVTVGALIYLLFRPRYLWVFTWVDGLGFTDTVGHARNLFFPYRTSLPEFVVFNLPNGLWVYATTSWMLLIWGNEVKTWAGSFWISIGLTSLVAMEILQHSEIALIPGTFDWFDIFAGVSGLCFAIYFINCSGSE